ncbi:MAG: hypothetical protein KF752_03185 [Pirellulaceae bacterium]|nr:hypothetical protein [Pirellulaceae bacterium]
MLKQEADSFGISCETQRKVEDIIEDVEMGRLDADDGLAIKDRLYRDGLDDTTAGQVIHLCILQGRFSVGTKKLTSSGSHFATHAPDRSMDWLGSLHYIELVDCSEITHKRLHGCYAPSVPRIGELLTPENGSTMKVVDVEWAVISQGQREGLRQPVLIPHVYLEEEQVGTAGSPDP